MTVLDGPGFTSLVFDNAELRAFRDRAARAFLVTARDALATTGRDIEKQLEAATEAAGLGRLARAWQSTVYPKAGTAEAPTVRIWPKGKARTLGALRAYAGGATIRSRTPGQLLAIPLRAAGPRYYGRGKTPVTPQEWERRTGLRLYPVKLRGKLYLATDGVVGKKTGRVAVKGTQRRLLQGRKVERLLIFLLLPEVQVARRVDFAGIQRRGPALLAAEFSARINTLIATLNEGANA